jgi:hypothetical protein
MIASFPSSCDPWSPILLVQVLAPEHEGCDLSIFRGGAIKEGGSLGSELEAEYWEGGLSWAVLASL